MRVLIIGEFSSFSKNLSAGFRALGHECFVFSWGDGYKNIKQDGESYTVIDPSSNLGGVVGKFLYYCKTYPSYLKLRKFVRQMSKGPLWDVALVISPGFIRRKYFFFHNRFTRRMIKSLVKNPANIFLSSCGGDLPYYDYWCSKDWKNKKLVINKRKHYLSKSGIAHFRFYSSFINKVIPVAYEYAEAWRKSKFTKSYTICPTIPLPVDTKKQQFKNDVGDKLLVFHGIVRPIDKGTEYIVPAMERLQKKYPNNVECVAKGGMPLDDYLVVLSRANILIDQTYASSTGMNALYALSMGKVLLGGNEPENSIEYHYPNIPVINIGPDSDMIFAELEKLVQKPDTIGKLSKDGRKYVELVHDIKIVAKQYIDTFIKYGVGLR